MITKYTYSQIINSSKFNPETREYWLSSNWFKHLLDNCDLCFSSRYEMHNYIVKHWQEVRGE